MSGYSRCLVAGCLGVLGVFMSGVWVYQVSECTASLVDQCLGVKCLVAECVYGVFPGAECPLSSILSMPYHTFMNKAVARRPAVST